MLRLAHALWKSRLLPEETGPQLINIFIILTLGLHVPVIQLASRQNRKKDICDLIVQVASPPLHNQMTIYQTKGSSHASKISSMVCSTLFMLARDWGNPSKDTQKPHLWHLDVTNGSKYYNNVTILSAFYICHHHSCCWKPIREVVLYQKQSSVDASFTSSAPFKSLGGMEGQDTK